MNNHKKSAPRRGAVLVLVLGVVAVLSALILGMFLSARSERIAAAHASDEISSRQHLHTALNHAINVELPLLLIGNGDPGSFVKHASKLGSHVSTNAFTSIDFAAYRSGSADFALRNFSAREVEEFVSAATNLLPGCMIGELKTLRPDWLPISVTTEDDDRTIGTNAWYAYIVADVSGFIDAHFATSNELARLEKVGAIADAERFMQDRARLFSAPFNATNYISMTDLARRNGGFSAANLQTPGLFIFSRDIAPDVTVTNGYTYAVISSLPFPPCLAEKFPINSITNFNDFSSADFRENWFKPVAERLRFLGFKEPEVLTWEIANFLDADKIPQARDAETWQPLTPEEICAQDWPSESTPLVNEVAVAQVPINFGATNHYAAAVELWYPFAPDPIIAADNAKLVVQVITNWQNYVDNESAADFWGIETEMPIEHMENNTPTEFLVWTSPSPYIGFPVEVLEVRQTRSEGAVEVTQPHLASMNKIERSSTGDGVWLNTETRYLPLGVTTYYTYDPPDLGANVWQRIQKTVTNELRVIARVYLDGVLVDEAAAYRQGDAQFTPFVFRAPGGWHIDDPRRNARKENWKYYSPTEIKASSGFIIPSHAGEVPEGTDWISTLVGTTNSICNPFGGTKQGLPVIHFNSPLKRAGDIGYVRMPFSRHDPENFIAEEKPLQNGFDIAEKTFTNLWHSIPLADPRILALHDTYLFSAGSILEIFTVRGASNPTNSPPCRGLIHPATRQKNVREAVTADLRCGPGGTFALPEAGIEWFENAWESIRATSLFGDATSIPIGVGDFCMTIGGNTGPGSYYACNVMDEAADFWHWRNSLGSDSKEDLLRDICERLTFRQQLYVVILAAQTATQLETVTARRFASALIARDAYTGAWSIIAFCEE